MLFVLCQFAFGALVQGSVTLTKDGNGFNFTTETAVSAGYDITLESSTGVSGCSGPYDLALIPSNGYIRGIGPNVDLNNTYTIPALGGSWSGYSSVGFPICQLGDGLTAYVSNGTYVNIFINSINGGQDEVIIEYEIQNSGSTTFRDPPTTGCYALTTQAQCEQAQQNGQPCMWNWGSSLCEEDTNTQQGSAGGGGMRMVECSEFEGNSNCANITVCEWNSGTEDCSPDVTNWSHTSNVGILCNNITDSRFCERVPKLNTMCSWNASAPAWARCIMNNSKSRSDMGSLDLSCEGIGTNQSLCEQAITNYYKPCQWDGAKCTFNQEGVFGGGGPGFFDDIGSQESCEATGGSWITETFKYADSYGNQKTDTDSWCEMGFGGFGTGIEGCNEMCWSCEDKARTDCTAGDTTCARSACENSTLGFCQFHEDTNAFNGMGWCDMKFNMMFGGGKSCDSECSSCDFLENASGKCNSSSAGCKWLVDPSGDYGWCEDKSAKYCANDCFSCYDSSECTAYGKGTPGACEWDNNNYICMPSGYDGEICFDGSDNDNDNKIDCDDPDCGFDHFCGGKFLDQNDCGQYIDASACSTGGCAWIKDEFDLKYGAGGHCGHPSEQCWQFNENETGCDTISDCNWKDVPGGACDINMTLSESCFNMDSNACNQSTNCIWQRDAYGGFGHCDFRMFRCHDAYFDDPAGCGEDSNCTWMQDPFAPGGGGRCEPSCFSLNSADCIGTEAGQGAGACQTQSGFCEPGSFGGNCADNDGNATGCMNNSACTWTPDLNFHNSSEDALELGWCNGMFEMQMFSGMEGGPPVDLGTDLIYPASGEPADPYTDIMFFGVKDNPTSFGFGIGVRSINDAAICNGMILSDFSTTGSGGNATKFFWYLDTDGNTTNGCTSDDSDQTGFEFKFKYLGELAGSEVVESRVAYQCVGGNFGPAAIGLSSWKQQMCSMLKGGMVSADKEALKRFKNLYNDTQNMRIYAVVAGNGTNESTPVDTIGPSYYTPGAFDFKMEDCFAPGQDLDGDGFDSENDPDCQDFKKYGFIPMEEGPGCKDGIDNDNDGKTDCFDESCKYDIFFCGTGLVARDDDKTAPSIVLHKKNIFPDTVKVSLTENKPANATLEFYGENAACGAEASINQSMHDTKFHTHHGFMLDKENLGFALVPNRTYAYKIATFDPSGNMAKSGCINFTTKASESEDDCPKCNFTIAPKFDSLTELNTSNATGNMYFSVDYNISDGIWDIENDSMEYGTKVSYKDGKNSTIRFTNLNSTEKWAIELKNIDLIESITSQTTTSTERSKPMGNMSGEFKYNTTNDSDKNEFIGMGSDKFKRMMQNMGAEEIHLTVPLTGNNLWHCEEDNLTNCVDVTNQTGVERTAYDDDSSTWTVPISFGLGFSVYSTSTTTTPAAAVVTSPSGGSSSTSTSGGLAKEKEVDESVQVGFDKIGKDTIKKVHIKGKIIPITKIEFKALTDLSSVTVTVRSFKQQPAKLEDSVPSAEVYKYLSVDNTNLKEENIDNIIIRFKVKKSWLEEKGAQPEDVRLRRYKTSWVTLTTAQDTAVEDAGDESDEYLYYMATTPGFSYFAITVPEKETEEIEESEPTEPGVTGEAVKDELGPPKERSPYLWLYWLVGALCGLIIVYLVLIITSGKSKKPKKRKRR